MDRWPDDYDPETKSRPTSRRNSASSRRNSLKKEEKRSPLNSSSSAHSTPKKAVKAPRADQKFDFVVTGKPLLKKSDRANSLPGTYHRRPSCDVTSKPPKSNRSIESKRLSNVRDNTRDEIEDMSMDLSQISDLEDISTKYGVQQRPPLATSTPKMKFTPKTRSASVHQQNATKIDKIRSEDSKSRDSTFSCSRDSLYKTSSSASPYRTGAPTELDYSSVSPEYSGQSSAELSPRGRCRRLEDHADSCNTSSCSHCPRGEWSRFWLDYSRAPPAAVQRYYDQCPTPYRTDTIDMADIDFSVDSSRKRSPEDMHNLNNIIRNEGLHLTPRETQNIIKCAHILGNVLTKAIERRSNDKDDITTKVEEIKPEIPDKIDPELELKKKTMSLDLTETVMPLEVKEEKTSETVTTQTDISLPNTKSAPRIFEKILRQLSRTSLEEKRENSLDVESKDKKDQIIEEKTQDGTENNQNDEKKNLNGTENTETETKNVENGNDKGEDIKNKEENQNDDCHSKVESVANTESCNDLKEPENPKV